MGEIGERIKYLRTELTGKKMSMAAFGEKLNVSPGAVAQWETSKDRKPSSAMIKIIAQEFEVNETWLLTGEGEMHAPMSREAEIAQITAKLFHDADPIRKQLFELVSGMNEEQLRAMKTIKDYVVDFMSKKE